MERERERTCKINHKDQRVLAESMMREPLIHSLELEWSPMPVEPDGGDRLACPEEDQSIKFTGGPFTNAYTKAPESPITDPTTFALPCHFPTLMPSILTNTNRYFKSFSSLDPLISAFLAVSNHVNLCKKSLLRPSAAMPSGQIEHICVLIFPFLLRKRKKLP